MATRKIFWFSLILGCVFLCVSISPAFASRFSLFALDVQVPLKEGQAVGEARKLAIQKGLRRAVEEATYKIIPQTGMGTDFHTLETEILDQPARFVPRYMILGEKRFPGTFDLSLQVTVDLVLLRKALLSAGLLKVENGARASAATPSTLEIRGLTDGKVLMEIMAFFKQRPDLAEGFKLVSACHGDFTFQFYPLLPLGKIASQVLYHARISEGTFKVISQDTTHLVLSYQMARPS